MGDRARGFYDKFRVERTDGKSALNEKHEGCEYFVLDLTHDPFTWPALQAYADACREKYPFLAADLEKKLVGFNAGLDAGRQAERELNKECREALSPLEASPPTPAEPKPRPAP